MLRLETSMAVSAIFGIADMKSGLISIELAKSIDFASFIKMGNHHSDDSAWGMFG